MLMAGYEKITDWSIGHLQLHDEKDEDDDDDPYSYDDPPEPYDVAAKLKEINAALSKESEGVARHRRVQFRDNPIAAEIPPDDTLYEDEHEEEEEKEEEEEEEDDDDGYGDSTEVSDEPEDSPTADDDSTVIVDVIEGSPKKSKSTPERPPKLHPCIENLALELAKLVSNEAIIKWHICQKVAINERAPPVMDKSSVDNDATITAEAVSGNDSNSTNISEVPPFETQITERNEVQASTESSVGSILSKKHLEEEEDRDESNNTDTTPKPLPSRSTDSAALLVTKDSRVLKTRSSTRPIRLNPTSQKHRKSNTVAVEETMVMSSEGKFFIVSMDDIRRTSSADHRPQARSTTMTTLPNVTTINRCSSWTKEQPPRKSKTQPTKHLSKLRLALAYMGSSTDDQTTGSKHGNRPVARRRANTAVLDTGSHQMVKDNRLSRVSYGLTVEQKEERERRAQETAFQRKSQQEREMEETKRRKERGQVAFREWLRLKKLNQNLKPQKSDPAKNTARSLNEESGGSAFREWLHRKQLQKEEERHLEELRLVHEKEIYCKKTREENERAFREWLLRKTRRRIGHCVHRITSPRFGNGPFGHQFNGQHRNLGLHYKKQE